MGDRLFQGMRGRGGVWLLLAMASLGAGCVGACANMDGIDRRIERVIGERSSLLGADAKPARVRPSAGVSSERTMYDRTPETINPSAGELVFDAADEARDVAARLNEFAERSGSAVVLDLEDVLRTSQSTAREFINAEEEYILAVIRLLIERHLWGPRFFNDVRASVDITPDGSGDYSSAARIVNEFRVTQRLPYGGDIEARALWEAAQQLRGVAGDQYRTASELAVSANLPLLRDAGLIAQEDIIQAERDVIYAARNFERFRREFFVSIATDYFDLLANAQSILNEQQRLSGLQFQRERTAALIAAGRRRSFELSSIEQDVLGSRNSLYNQQEFYRVSLDRFKIRLGIPVEQEVVIAPVSLELPEPAVSLEQASRAALMYRLDFQNALDRFEDARRSVLNARNQLLPDLDVGVSAVARSDPETDDKKGFTVDLDDTSFLASVTFGLPLDREIERLGLRSALIGAQRQARELDERRDSIVLEARAAVRNIELARLSIQLRRAQVEQNLRRLEEIEIDPGSVDTQDQLQAQADLLNARNSLSNAERDLRVAILNYLLATDQLRVGVDGDFEPLVGMMVREGEVIDPATLTPGLMDAVDPAGIGGNGLDEGVAGDDDGG